jgi:Ser/Thr protein kinase RdoA (MazF antagonist)
VPSADGLVWFKESAPSLAFEPALTVALARRRPDCLPRVLHTEGPRMLTRDVGPQLRALLEAGEPAPSWEEIATLYAELQLELVPDAEALPAPDSRPETIAARYGAEDLLEQLGEVVPLSLVHEEVHDGNVFVRDGAPVFIDWAEACIAHPFCGLVNTLRAIGPAGAPRIRDSYLASWTGFARLPDLRKVFAAAYALGCLCRAATWERVVTALPEDSEDRLEYTHNVDAWLEIYAAARRRPDRLGE